MSYDHKSQLLDISLKNNKDQVSKADNVYKLSRFLIVKGKKAMTILYKG